MATLLVSGQALGSKRPLFADWSIPIPREWSEGEGLTLRDLIAGVVREEVHAFRQRQDERRVFRALTARQIAEGAEKGKIESGGSEVPLQPVDEDESIAVARQAFEDGMYLVVIDGETCREIDREIHVRPDSRVTFVRLTMLAGG